MAFEKILQELRDRKHKALQQGGREKVKQQHEKGRLTARERIDALLDPDSFIELGLLAGSDIPKMAGRTPADGWIMGYGLINGSHVGIIANDFTVLGASNARVNTKKAAHMRNHVTEKGIPLIWLGEASGGRLPDVEGSKGILQYASA